MSSSSSLYHYFLTNYSSKCPQYHPDSDSEPWIATWQGLAFTSHTMTILILPFHILGGYCILFKTPVYMTYYKWPLFNLHFWSCFVDILINALITPYLIFPAVAGFPVGLLSAIHIPVEPQIWMGIMSIFAMIMSMTILFENRHNSIPSNKLRISSGKFKFLYYSARLLIVGIYSFAIFLMVPPNQELAHLELLKKIPCPTSDFFNSSVYVLCDHELYINILAAATSLGVLFEIAQMLFFISCCLYYLFFSLNGFTSKKTRKLQIAFFGSILMQVAIPIFFLMPSFIFLVYSVVFKYYNQALTNFCVLYASIHGFLSTIVVLVIHKPYRKFLRSIFGKKSAEIGVFHTRKSMVDTRKMSTFPTFVNS